MKQKTTDKGKGIAEEVAAGGSSDGDEDDDNHLEDAAFEEARRKSLLENYSIDGEPSRNVVANVAAATTTELATTEVLEEEHVEEKLVDYEPSPEVVGVPCDLLLNVVREDEENEAIRRTVHEDSITVICEVLPNSTPAQDVSIREVVSERTVEPKREVLQPEAEISRVVK